MQKFELKNMVKGWFVGNFDPCVAKSQDFEAAVKMYSAGDYEQTHHHKLAYEITVIATGRVKMNGVEYGAGDILYIAPNEATDFLVLEDAITFVVKSPSASNDKFLGSV